MVFSGFLSGLPTIPLDRIIAPLGPLSDLCVVVIIAWNPWSRGFASNQTAINPDICAISA